MSEKNVGKNSTYIIKCRYWQADSTCYMTRQITKNNQMFLKIYKFEVFILPELKFS